MPFNGIGGFTLVAGNPVVTGTTISSTVQNNTMTDFANGFANCMTRDGQSPALANVPMGGFKLTGLAAGTTNGDAVRWEQAVLKTDLADTASAPNGAGLSGYKYTNAYAANTVGGVLNENISVFRAGAFTTSEIADVVNRTAAVDLSTKIATAISVASTAGLELTFPAGTYGYATTLDFGYANFTARALGKVILKHTGTGKAVTIDGGAAGGGIYNNRFLGFIVQGNANTTDGIFVRASHHGVVDARVSTACTTGLRVNWCVCTNFYFTCSTNETLFTTTPTNGIYLDIRGAGEYVSYCTFWNPIIEATVTGMTMGAALGNSFIGGTFEGCTTGVYLGDANTSGNKFYDTDFEANSSVDVSINADAKFNEFHGVDTAKFFYIVSGSSNKVFGGQHELIRIDAGVANAFIGTNYNRNATGSFVDNVPVHKVSVYNSTAGTFDQDQGIFSPIGGSTPTAGASPYTYTNSANYPVELQVNGGTVSQVTFERGAYVRAIATATGCQVRLDPGDASTISYTVAPTLGVVPR